MHILHLPDFVLPLREDSYHLFANCIKLWSFDLGRSTLRLTVWIFFWPDLKALQLQSNSRTSWSSLEQFKACFLLKVKLTFVRSLVFSWKFSTCWVILSNLELRLQLFSKRPLLFSMIETNMTGDNRTYYLEYIY